MAIARVRDRGELMSAAVLMTSCSDRHLFDVRGRQISNLAASFSVTWSYGNAMSFTIASARSCKGPRKPARV